MTQKNETVRLSALGARIVAQNMQQHGEEYHYVGAKCGETHGTVTATGEAFGRTAKRLGEAGQRDVQTELNAEGGRLLGERLASTPEGREALGIVRDLKATGRTQQQAARFLAHTQSQQFARYMLAGDLERALAVEVSVNLLAMGMAVVYGD